MKRRDFLCTLGAAALMPKTGEAQTPSTSLRAGVPGATALYDGHAIPLDKIIPDPAKGNALWIQKSDLKRVNGFELKPQGACRDDICIPVPGSMSRGSSFNLSAFARRAGQTEVVDNESRVWSFGEIPVVRGSFLENRMAPDVTVPDRKGRPVRLSQFRGRKVLLVTWASW